MGNSEEAPEGVALKKFNILSYLLKPRQWQWKYRGIERYVKHFFGNYMNNCPPTVNRGVRKSCDEEWYGSVN